MLMIAILILLLAVTSGLDRNRNYMVDYVKLNRIVFIIFILSAYLAYNILDVKVLAGGIGIYGGVFKITVLSQIFDIIMLIIGGIVSLLTCFIPYNIEKKINMEVSSIFEKIYSNYKSISNSNVTKNNFFIEFLIKFLPKIKINTPYLLEREYSNNRLEVKEYNFLLLFTVLGGSLLISSQNLISLYLSLELQSFSCAPREVYIEEILVTSIILILSGIFGLLIYGRYLPPVITKNHVNNGFYRIANHLKISRTGLPLLEIYLSGDSHGQVNKFETYRGAQLGPGVLSRISRHLKGKLNVTASRLNSGDCQKPFTHFSIEDKRAQSPKTIMFNVNITQPRDLTAYGYKRYQTRGRSFHSSIKHTKGNSQKMPLPKTHDSNTKGNNELNLIQGSKLIISVSS